MKVYIVGNQLMREDNGPVSMLPTLKKELPALFFEEVDPTENFTPEEGSVIIDTVKGITNVRWFDSLEEFELTQSVSPHDYDLSFHLRLLMKLKKISHIKILGVPSYGDKRTRMQDVVSALLSYSQGVL